MAGYRNLSNIAHNLSAAILREEGRNAKLSVFLGGNMGAGMITAITPRILIDECSRRGLDRKALLAQLGIAPNHLDDPSARVPVEVIYALWDLVIPLTADPMFAIRTAENVPFGTYRTLDYMLAASSTPREALARSSRSFALVNSAFILSLRFSKDLAYLELSNCGRPQDLPRPYIEYIFVNYLMKLRFSVQAKWSPLEVHVTYGKPPLSQEYDRIFEARVRFNQGINRMVFARHLMEMPHPFADAELCEMLEGHARRKLDGSPSQKNPLAEIQRALLENRGTGTTSLASIARQLAKSSRSLQREIHSHGTSFRELHDAVRVQHARDLLQDHDLPINKVAERLRFSDTSSFCHAFQRWTGKSPHKFRKHSE